MEKIGKVDSDTAKVNYAFRCDCGQVVLYHHKHDVGKVKYCSHCLKTWIVKKDGVRLLVV